MDRDGREAGQGRAAHGAGLAVSLAGTEWALDNWQLHRRPGCRAGDTLMGCWPVPPRKCASSPHLPIPCAAAVWGCSEARAPPIPARTSWLPLLSLCPLRTVPLTEADKSHFQDGLIQFSTIFAGFGDVWLPVGDALNVTPQREGLLGRVAPSRWGPGWGQHLRGR